MELTWGRLDLEQTFKAGIDRPNLVFDRGRAEHWVVATSPVTLQRPTEWTHFNSEDQLAIELFPYLLRPEPDLAFAYLFACGLKCATQELRRPIRRLHVVTGVPVIEVDPKEAKGELTHRYWMGFGVLLD